MKKNRCEDIKARFDVVVIHQKGVDREIEVIRNAFDLAYPWRRASNQSTPRNVMRFPKEFPSPGGRAREGEGSTA